MAPTASGDKGRRQQKRMFAELDTCCRRSVCRHPMPKCRGIRVYGEAIDRFVVEAYYGNCDRTLDPQAQNLRAVRRKDERPAVVGRPGEGGEDRRSDGVKGSQYGWSLRSLNDYRPAGAQLRQRPFHGQLIIVPKERLERLRIVVQDGASLSLCQSTRHTLHSINPEDNSGVQQFCVNGRSEM